MNGNIDIFQMNRYFLQNNLMFLARISSRLFEFYINPNIKKIKNSVKMYDRLKKLNNIGQKKTIAEKFNNIKEAGRKKETALKSNNEM